MLPAVAAASPLGASSDSRDPLFLDFLLLALLLREPSSCTAIDSEMPFAQLTVEFIPPAGTADGLGALTELPGCLWLSWDLDSLPCFANPTLIFASG